MPKTTLDGADWLTVGGAAEYLGIAHSTFRAWVDAGRIASFTTPGGHRRVTRHALERFVRLQTPRDPSELHRAHVLVIDDDPTVRNVIRTALEAGNFEVTEAASAAEAVKCINERIPELLMIDIAMPGTDGWQLLRKLRERLDADELPVLVFSGSEPLQLADERGAQAYARKPFDPRHLVEQARLLTDHAQVTA